MSKTIALPTKFSPGFRRRLDQRTPLARRLNEHYESITSDLGGADGLARTKLVLVERLLFLVEVLEAIEAKIIADPAAESDLLGKWTAACNSAQGLVRALGLERVDKATGLETILKGRSA